MITQESPAPAEGPWYSRLIGGARSMLGYDAVQSQDKRRQAPPTLKNEDVELDSLKRRQMVANTRDMLRNFAIASWALRKHLDFVSRFTFSSNTKTDFDLRFEELIAEQSEAGTCEVTGTMSLAQLVRTTELRSTADGDSGWVKLSSGQVQFVAGDRVRDGLGFPEADSIYHGVRIDRVGRALSYAVHRRTRWGGFQYEREIPAENMLWHAYREGAEQVRGISPFAPGLNSLQDVYEGYDYALQKAKISQLFGLVFTRDGLSQVQTLEQTEEEEAAEDDDSSRYGTVDATRGHFKLELEPGDKVDWLESKTPSVETMELLKSMIGVALKSLDIPLCFYDEGLTNFFGQRAALILYLESCKTKRQNLITNILAPWTRWQAQRWVLEGKLVLPAGATLRKLPFTWQPAGCPYWNPSQKVNADVQAIKAGLATFEDVYRERTGRDWFADMERLSEQYKHLQTLGLPIDPQLVPVILSSQKEGADNAFQAAFHATAI